MHGVYHRDELLFGVLGDDAAGTCDEVRDVLPGYLPMACRTIRTPEPVVVVARKHSGGALEGAAAAHLLQRWMATPPTAVLDFALSALELRGPTLVVGRDGDARQLVFPANPKFPLAGVHLVSARRLAATVRGLAPSAHVTSALSMLDLCVSYRFVVSVVAC